MRESQRFYPYTKLHRMGLIGNNGMDSVREMGEAQGPVLVSVGTASLSEVPLKPGLVGPCTEEDGIHKLIFNPLRNSLSAPSLAAQVGTSTSSGAGPSPGPSAAQTSPDRRRLNTSSSSAVHVTLQTNNLGPSLRFPILARSTQYTHPAGGESEGLSQAGQRRGKWNGRPRQLHRSTAFSLEVNHLLRTGRPSRVGASGGMVSRRECGGGGRPSKLVWAGW